MRQLANVIWRTGVSTRYQDSDGDDEGGRQAQHEEAVTLQPGPGVVEDEKDGPVPEVEAVGDPPDEGEGPEGQDAGRDAGRGQGDPGDDQRHHHVGQQETTAVGEIEERVDRRPTRSRRRATATAAIEEQADPGPLGSVTVGCRKSRMPRAAPVRRSWARVSVP